MDMEEYKETINRLEEMRKYFTALGFVCAGNKYTKTLAKIRLLIDRAQLDCEDYMFKYHPKEAVIYSKLIEHSEA